MSRVCEISGKRPKSGNSRSHSMRATKRTFTPNSQKKRIFDKKTGRWVRVKMAASVIRTLTKDQRMVQKKIKKEMEEANL